jgi:hypothetical protein
MDLETSAHRTSQRQRQVGSVGFSSYIAKTDFCSSFVIPLFTMIATYSTFVRHALGLHPTLVLTMHFVDRNHEPTSDWYSFNLHT